MSDSFDGADFYDCRGAESLCFESPEEAIEDLLDMYATPDCDMVALIAEHSPITVTAYRRAEIPDAEWAAFALNAAIGILESMDEEYGDPDGRLDRNATEKLLGAALEPALRAWCREHYQPWQCNDCGSREYQAEGIEAMMREYNSHWFEP